MSANASSVVNLESRLAQLEALVSHQQRRLRTHRAIGVAAALLLSAGAMTAAVAQRTAPAVVQAQRLEIVSADGKLLMAAGAGVTGGRLEMIDNNGNVKVAAQAGASGGQFDLWNAAGRNVLRAGSNEHGGDIAIWNAEGRNVMGAYATAHGGETALWGSDGKPLFKANANDTGPGGLLTVYAENGVRAFAAGAETDGCGRIDVFNNANNAVFSVDGQKDLGCVMALSNNIGSRLFMLGTRANGGLMNVMNDRGDVMGMFGVAENGAGAMTLRNSSGMEVVHAGTDESRDGIITVRDAANAMMRVMRPGR